MHSETYYLDVCIVFIYMIKSLFRSSSCKNNYNNSLYNTHSATCKTVHHNCAFQHSHLWFSSMKWPAYSGFSLPILTSILIHTRIYAINIPKKMLIFRLLSKCVIDSALSLSLVCNLSHSLHSLFRVNELTLLHECEYCGSGDYLFFSIWFKPYKHADALYFEEEPNHHPSKTSKRHAAHIFNWQAIWQSIYVGVSASVRMRKPSVYVWLN